MPFSRHLGDGLDLEGDDHGFVPAGGLSAGMRRINGQPVRLSYRTLGNDLIQAAVHVEDGRQWARVGGREGGSKRCCAN